MHNISFSAHPTYSSFVAAPGLHHALSLPGLLYKCAHNRGALYDEYNNRRMKFDGFNQCDAFHVSLREAYGRAHRIAFHAIAMREQDPRKYMVVLANFFDKADRVVFCRGEFLILLPDGTIGISYFGKP